MALQAVHLSRYIKGADLPGVDYVTDVVKELDRQIDAMQRGNKSSHKSTKVRTYHYLHIIIRTVHFLLFYRSVLRSPINLLI